MHVVIKYYLKINEKNYSYRTLDIYSIIRLYFKKKPEKKRDSQNKYDVNEKQLMINRNNHSSYKFDEPINNNLNISNKQPPVKHSSRNLKGKIINTKNHTFVLE